MYETVKRLLYSVLPQQAMQKVKPTLRRMNALLYVGNKVRCGCCEGNFSSWIVLGNGDEICPRCGSLPRTRRLWKILSPGLISKHNEMLHFSPSAVLRTKLKAAKGAHYYPTDYLGEFEADYQYNIENIPVSVNKFDLIVCYHVLEHIENDAVAMQELYRVLTPGGVCLIQTPFREGEIYENPNVTSPEERERHFGQNDHVRVYSAEGLKQRLQSAGFEVEITVFPEDTERGLRNNETVLFARKP